MTNDGPLKDVIAIFVQYNGTEELWKLYDNAKTKTRVRAQKKAKALRKEFGLKFRVTMVQTPAENKDENRQEKEKAERIGKIVEEAFKDLADRGRTRRGSRMGHFLIGYDPGSKEEKETTVLIRVTDEGEGNIVRVIQRGATDSPDHGPKGLPE